MHFTIHFVGDSRPPYEYEADSLEEKNKIFRLLSLIVTKNRASRGETRVSERKNGKLTPQCDGVMLPPLTLLPMLYPPSKLPAMAATLSKHLH